MQQQRDEAIKLLDELRELISDHTMECETGVEPELARKLKEVQLWLLKFAFAEEKRLQVPS